jgi:hypothetical protein
MNASDNHNRLVPELLNRLIKEARGDSDAMVALESLIVGVMLFHRPNPRHAAEFLDSITARVIERMHDAARTN